MVTNTELARIMGLNNKSAINNILGKGQNIQPDAWEKFRKHFNLSDPQQSSQINELISAEKSEPSAREILMVLAEAIEKHERSSLKHAEAYGKLADALKSQHDSFVEMRKEMARADTQADMKINLDEVRSIVDKISKGQNKGLEVLLKGFAKIHADQSRVMTKDKRKVGDGEGE